MREAAATEIRRAITGTKPPVTMFAIPKGITSDDEVIITLAYIIVIISGYMVNYGESWFLSLSFTAVSIADLF